MLGSDRMCADEGENDRETQEQATAAERETTIRKEYKVRWFDKN